MIVTVVCMTAVAICVAAGADDEIPEDASLAELEALLDEKIERGALPEEHAKKLLKVLESADQHNKRLERLDEQLFGESSY